MRVVLRLARSRPLPTELPDEASRFWTALRALPTRQAQALALHYYEDMSVRDVAAVLHCGEATVKTHLHRGRQALATKLGYEEEP